MGDWSKGSTFSLRKQYSGLTLEEILDRSYRQTVSKRDGLGSEPRNLTLVVTVGGAPVKWTIPRALGQPAAHTGADTGARKTLFYLSQAEAFADQHELDTGGGCEERACIVKNLVDEVLAAEAALAG